MPTDLPTYCTVHYILLPRWRNDIQSKSGNNHSISYLLPHIYGLYGPEVVVKWLEGQTSTKEKEKKRKKLGLGPQKIIMKKRVRGLSLRM